MGLVQKHSRGQGGTEGREMAGVAAAVVGGLALAGGAAARGLGETQSWMGAIVDEAKVNVRSPFAPAAPLCSREAAATPPPPPPPPRPITPDATHESAKRSWDIFPSSPGAGGLPAAISGFGEGGDFPGFLPSFPACTAQGSAAAPAGTRV